MNEWFKSGYRNRLAKLNGSLLVAFLFVVLSLVFWSTLQVNFLAAREDNPRVVEEELRIRRGRIFDANEVVLAQNEGTPERQRRVYPLPIGEPVIGYYSVRFGTAGVEEALDPLLRGTTSVSSELLARELLNKPAAGKDIRLTLDIGLQANALRLMAGQQGAAVLLSLPDGAVRAMVSLPSFDPNRLEENFDLLAADQRAPLLNRVTQGQYQPGLILQPFLGAAALENGILRPTDLPDRIDDQSVILDLLHRRWAVADLEAAIEQFGFLDPPTVQIPVAEVPSLAVQDFKKALWGEENLTVSPLQVALAGAVLGTGGRTVQAQLVSGVREAGRWQAYNRQSAQVREPILAESTAGLIRERLAQVNVIQEYAVVVPAGPETNISWFLGMVPHNNPRYIAVVVLERVEDPEIVRGIGRRLLELAVN